MTYELSGQSHCRNRRIQYRSKQASNWHITLKIYLINRRLGFQKISRSPRSEEPKVFIREDREDFGGIRLKERTTKCVRRVNKPSMVLARRWDCFMPAAVIMSESLYHYEPHLHLSTHHRQSSADLTTLCTLPRLQGREKVVSLHKK